jgi:hypothetical protein
VVFEDLVFLSFVRSHLVEYFLEGAFGLLLLGLLLPEAVDRLVDQSLVLVACHYKSWRGNLACLGLLGFIFWLEGDSN